MMFPEKLQAARLRLVRERPYLASALWALTPVERPGLGTLAVDRWWRVYYDPQAVQAWSVQELAGVLYHGVCHLLRAHHLRAEAVGAEAQTWNFASDAEINDDLREEKVSLPGEPVFPETLGLPEGKLAEEYYAALTQAQQGSEAQQGARPAPQSPEAGGEGQAGEASEAGPDGTGRGDAGATAAQEDTAPADGGAASGEDGSTPSATAGGGGDADGSQPKDGGTASGPQPGDAAGSTSAAASGRPAAASQGPAGPGDGAGGTEPTPSGAAAQTPAPGAGRCGSCAHGHQEPWEEGPPGESGVPGITQAEAEIIRRRVAEEIRRIAESSRDRGTVPGHWARWAEEMLRPRVDWRRELASTVRQALADVAGAADYTYRRPSRRQVPDVILPGLRQPVPRVAVVVDTSGSISDTQLATAVAEVAGILRAAGHREGVHVFAVDSAVQAAGKAFTTQQVSRLLAGGGGTDMGVGLEAASKLRPQPHLTVVITDGHTPWPAEPPRDCGRVVVLLVGDGESPEWAKVIRMEEVNRHG